MFESNFLKFPNLVYKIPISNPIDVKISLLKSCSIAKITGKVSLKWHYEYEKSRPLNK